MIDLVGKYRHGKTERFVHDHCASRFFVSMAKSKLKNISGRPKISPTKKELDLAIQYVKISGLYKNRLADYMSVSRRTLYRILNRNKDFDTALKRADAEFCANLICRANPTKILTTKYWEEFGEKAGSEQQRDQEIDIFFNGIKTLMQKQKTT